MFRIINLYDFSNFEYNILLGLHRRLSDPHLLIFNGEIAIIFGQIFLKMVIYQTLICDVHFHKTNYELYIDVSHQGGYRSRKLISWTFPGPAYDEFLLLIRSWNLTNSISNHIHFCSNVWFPHSFCCKSAAFTSTVSLFAQQKLQHWLLIIDHPKFIL